MLSDVMDLGAPLTFVLLKCFFLVLKVALRLFHLHMHTNANVHAEANACFCFSQTHLCSVLPSLLLGGLSIGVPLRPAQDLL